jgi:hypothetical protein
VLTSATMSSRRFSEHSNPREFVSGHARATDTVGMQDLFSHYTRYLPPTRTEDPSSCGYKAIAIIEPTGFLGLHIVALCLLVVISLVGM